jgi:hypothetical protein
MRRLLIALSLVFCAAIAVPAIAEQGKGEHKGHGQDRIALPDGFRPEGIATKGRMFFVGSIPTGDIYGGDLRTGEGDIVIDAPDGRAATGIKVDRRNRVFVSGADTGQAYVYDLRTGQTLASYQLFDSQEEGDTFINDVVVTRRAAYFTDSVNQQFYVLEFGRHGALPAEAVTRPIEGELVYTDGFNANGIEAAKGGRTLIIVKSNTGELFTADPETGDTKKIAVTGGDGELVNGDGILRKGRKLYVSENRDTNAGKPGTGEVTAVKLRRDLSSGRIVKEISSADFDVPTTLARSHGRLYAVNARFNTPPTPDTEYWVSKVPKR